MKLGSSATSTYEMELPGGGGGTMDENDTVDDSARVLPDATDEYGVDFLVEAPARMGDRKDLAAWAAITSVSSSTSSSTLLSTDSTTELAVMRGDRTPSAI